MDILGSKWHIKKVKKPILHEDKEVDGICDYDTKTIIIHPKMTLL